MDNKIIMLLIAIVAIWLLLNPKSREYIKTATGKVFNSPTGDK